jgi:hypothetical protein
LCSLIDQINSAAPSALVVVASIIPSQNDGTNKNFQTYNAAIPDVVKTKGTGKHVVFLDNWAAFSADTSYKTKLMSDNLVGPRATRLRRCACPVPSEIRNHRYRQRSPPSSKDLRSPPNRVRLLRF